VIELAGRGHLPGGSKRNMKALASTVDYGNVGSPLREILTDAQTSGGLLISVHPDRLEFLMAALEAERTPVAAVIGSIGSAEGIRLS
jgi:selenide,water dikinase